MKRKRWVTKQGIFFLAVCTAGISLSGCTSKIAQEIISQVYEEEKEKKDKSEDAEKQPAAGDGSSTQSESEEENLAEDSLVQDGFSGNYEQFIKDELEPRLGTAKNTQFSYGFERIVYEGSSYWFASPMKAAMENGIVSTYRRDLNKDGQDELLVVYVEGSRQSSDGMNHFNLDIYGHSGDGLVQLGKVSFDNCFSGYNGEMHMFGLKDLGNKQLIYAGGNGSVWTWADGVEQEIRLYQLEGSGVNEVFQVSEAGSDYSWMEDWRRQLQGYGFDLADSQWSECNLAGESGFEVLAYGECSTRQPKTDSYGLELQQVLLESGTITGSIYGPDSQVVMQMNQTMRTYGSGRTAYSGGNTETYPAGNSGYSGNMENEYILPNSSTMYLSQSDLIGLSEEELRLARNEIYARHGRKFKTKEIQDYFNRKSWYTGTIESDAFKDSYLNIYEKENIKLIQRMEKQ